MAEKRNHVIPLPMPKELWEKVEEAKDRFGLDEFWLEFTQKEDLYQPNVIRNGWHCYPHIPSMKVNTIVFHVIYSKGYLKHLWVLPREQKLDRTAKDGGEEFVHNSQKRYASAPVIHKAKSA